MQRANDGAAATTRRAFLGALGVAGVTAVRAEAGLGAQAARPATPAAQPICVFSKHIDLLDDAALAGVVAESGFDGIDLSVRPKGHVDPARVEDDLPKAVEAARRAGLQVPLIVTAINGAPDPLVERTLATAAGLGVRHYRLGTIAYDERLGVRKTLEALAPRLRSLAALNERLGIRGAIQNHAGTNVGAAVWDLSQLLDAVGSPWLGCQYDVRHAVIEGGQSWVRGLEVVLPHVTTVAVKDGYWEKANGAWRPNTVPLGEGMVDWRRFVDLARKAGLAVPLTMHFEYPIADGVADPAARRRETVRVMREDLTRLRALLAAARA